MEVKETVNHIFSEAMFSSPVNTKIIYTLKEMEKIHNIRRDLTSPRPGSPIFQAASVALPSEHVQTLSRRQKTRRRE